MHTLWVASGSQENLGAMGLACFSEKAEGMTNEASSAQQHTGNCVSTISPGLGAFFWTGRLTLRYEKRKHSQKRKGRSSSVSAGT